MSNHTTFRRSTAQQLQGFRRFMSVSILMSLAVVFFSMQLMMVGPLKGQLDRIQKRLDLSDHSLKRLVSARDSVWRANDLLASLEQQADRLSKVDAAITSIETVRNRLARESSAAQESLAALDQIEAVNDQLGQQSARYTHRTVGDQATG